MINVNYDENDYDPKKNAYDRNGFRVPAAYKLPYKMSPLCLPINPIPGFLNLILHGTRARTIDVETEDGWVIVN